jgi:hypothetical protein
MLKRTGEVSDRRDRYGYQQVRNRVHAAQLKPENFKPSHDASWLNIEHDDHQTVGKLAALERAHTGVWGTWISGDITLLRLPGVYVSGEVAWRSTDSDANDIELRGAAIVPSTAAVCTRPALILAGRLDDRTDRQRWRLHPAQARLERAAEQSSRRQPGGTIYLHDELEAQAREAEIRERKRHVGPWFEQSRSGRPPGRIEHSQHRGRVLRVG